VLASYPRDAKDPDSLLEYADKAMYRAKGAGKNNIALFHNDRRRYLRIDRQRPLAVRPLGTTDATVPGHTVNLGIGGIFFSCARAFPPEQFLEITVQEPDGDLFCIGRVVRCTPETPDRHAIGVSLAFQELDRRYKNHMARLLAQEEEKA